MTRLRVPPRSVSEKMEHLCEQIETLESQLIQAQRLATLGTLTTVLAHEINNILMAIMNRADPRLSTNEDAMRQALEKTVGSCERASVILQSLLGFANPVNNEVQKVKAAKLMEDALALLVRDPAKDGITLVKELDESLTLECRPVEMVQVLLNLLVNARHAMADGGKLTLRASREQDCVALSVADTGVGIPPENMEKIFEPFFTTRPAGSGTGLGLYVTRNIVRQHGGEIGVVSRPGHGAIFTVYVPEAR